MYTRKHIVLSSTDLTFFFREFYACRLENVLGVCRPLSKRRGHVVFTQLRTAENS
jgi:hypothetical protein